jgi:cysteine desulfurase/selenocysteine lyase
MPIAEAVGLGAAADYLTGVGLTAVRAHEQDLLRHALSTLAEIDGLRILGPADTTDRGGAISFVLDGIHPHDVSQVLDDRGVAVRAGHHCAWPLHRALGVQASTRASLYLYNTHDEVDALVDGIRQVQKFFGTA